MKLLNATRLCLISFQCCIEMVKRKEMQEVVSIIIFSSLFALEWD